MKSKPNIFGSICHKHPELNGERRASKSRSAGILTPHHCPACDKEYDYSYRARRAELKRERYRNDPIEERNKVRDWRIKNREKSLASTRDSAARWRERNPELSKENQRIWCAKNRHIMNAISAKRRAATAFSTPSWNNKFFMEEAYALANLRTKMLGFKWHVDHIVPLRSKIVCGLHVHNNLQVVPAIVNLKKGNRSWPDMPNRFEV